MESNGPEGFIYLVHLDQALGNGGNNGANSASHYTGWAEDVPARMRQHRRGQGSRMLAEASRRGIRLRVVALERGTRERERQLKTIAAAPTRCPICNERRRKEDDMRGARAHKSAPGIRSVTRYRVVCGGCGAHHDENAHNVTEARRGFAGWGWRNGYREEPVYIGGDPPEDTIGSTWRCPTCLPERS